MRIGNLEDQGPRIAWPPSTRSSIWNGPAPSSALGLLNVRRTASGGEVVELGQTTGARRQVPLIARASAALDALPARLDTPLLFPAPRGGVLDLNHFRLREWTPAVETSGVRTPARIYDLRSTFASDALDAGVGTYGLARIMGTSGRMIERHLRPPARRRDGVDCDPARCA